jgi:predicted  nucleic acid-binding Zn-ribbon protein
MTGDVENLILEHLRRFDRRQEAMAADLHDVKVRLSSLEQGLALVNQRIDRVEERLSRIERRLELVDS